jgi:hypothetical protein
LKDLYLDRCPLVLKYSGKHISAIVAYPRKEEEEREFGEKRKMFLASVRNVLIVI